MTRIGIAALTTALLLAGISCDSTHAPSHAPAAACDSCDQSACPSPPATAKIEVPTTGVRSIVLPAIETELPPGPGRLTVMLTCTACHSQRYVMMQPNFPRKTWAAEVDKMKKVYGAPIQEEQVEPIVNYLVSVRGNGK